MNTLHFRYALEIEKTRSITQAAENLYMAQPNLSKAIKELENTLGITIFRRTAKGVIPTDQGMRFLECARQVLIQIDNMEAIHAPDKSQKQKIKVSSPRTDYISCAFSQLVSGFDCAEGIEVVLHETNPVKVISDVRERGYDFGIIRFRKIYEKYFLDYLAEKNLDHRMLWEFEMLALMPQEHPMASESVITYEALCGCSVEIIEGDFCVPYIFPNGSIREETVIAGIKRKTVSVFDRAGAYDMLTASPRTFMMVSPTSEELLKRYRLVQRKCSAENNVWCDMIIYASGRELTETELRLVDMLCRVRNKTAFARFY